MRIRAASPADTGTLVELMTRFYRQACYGLQREAARSAFEQQLENPAIGRVWICEQATEAIGTIVLTLGFSMAYGGRDGFVEDLFVRPRFRGRGAGKRLLDTLIGKSARLGVRALHLEVGSANHRARRLYGSRGFKDNDRRLLTMRLNPGAHQPDGRAQRAETNALFAGDTADRGRNHE